MSHEYDWEAALQEYDKALRYSVRLARKHRKLAKEMKHAERELAFRRGMLEKALNMRAKHYETHIDMGEEFGSGVTVHCVCGDSFHGVGLAAARIALREHTAKYGNPHGIPMKDAVEGSEG